MPSNTQRSLNIKTMKFPNGRSPEFFKIPATQQKKLALIIIFVIIIFYNPTKAQSLHSSPTADHTSKPSRSTTNIHPSLAIVIGLLSIMLALTFLILVYAKCWHTPASLRYLNQENFGAITRSVSRDSGIDKTVIESIPFFRFSTLKGWRDGLECSICLSRFDDVEILRLLPKCKHAFHIDCVDQWLDKHSGCPLCRCKVREEDVKLFACSSSFRFLNNQSARQGSNLELFVEREGSARFASRRSVGKNIEKEDDEEIWHKFNHRIVISGYAHDQMMGKNRWSSLSSSDLLFLKSEMITSLSSNFFEDGQETVASMSSNKLNHNPDHQVIKIKEEINRKQELDRRIEKRSMSEIIVHPRFLGVEASNNEGNYLGDELRGKEERLKRLWLPIARRTIQLFADRDQPSQINSQDREFSLDHP